MNPSAANQAHVATTGQQIARSPRAVEMPAGGLGGGALLQPPTSVPPAYSGDSPEVVSLALIAQLNDAILHLDNLISRVQRKVEFVTLPGPQPSTLAGTLAAPQPAQPGGPSPGGPTLSPLSQQLVYSIQGLEHLALRLDVLGDTIESSR